MKKIAKLIAGLATAAALFGVVGCKNQLTYVEENAARNAFNFAGLYVEGLDKSFNGSEIELKVVTYTEDGDKEETTYATGLVADSYTNSKGEIVGYQSGKAYVALDEPLLYDGDKMAGYNYKANSTSDKYSVFTASKFECYLKVGGETVKTLSSDGLSLENAKLSVPQSEAGTADKDLASKWVKILVKDGVGTFTLASSADEPINVTLWCVKGVDLVNTANEAALPKGVTISTTPTTCTTPDVAKYKITIKGLEKNNGETVVLAGARISKTGTDLAGEASGDSGQYWYDNNEDKNTLGSAEIKDGAVSFEFYGRDVPSGWGRSYGAGHGPEIKIYAKDGKEGTKTGGTSGICLLQRGDGADNNFVFPGYAIKTGDKLNDVELTIDVAGLANHEAITADPTVESSTIYIDAIKMSNAPEFTKPTGGYFAFLSDWLDGNQWNSTTPNKITDRNYITDDGYAYLIKKFEYTPSSTTFKLDVQVVNAPLNDTTDDWNTENSFWHGKIAEISTPVLQTTDYATNHYILVIERASIDATSAYLAWLEPAENDANYASLYSYQNQEDLTGWYVQDWYNDDWSGAPEGATLVKVTDRSWKWTITTTTAMPSYKFSVIKAEGNWGDGRYELADSKPWVVGSETGPLNYNNEPSRKTIDLEASSTYTFTLTSKPSGMYLTTTKN